jgi:hypothetical protein
MTVASLIVATLGLAHLSWLAIERPFRDRQRFTSRHVWTSALFAAGALVAFGVVGHATGGFLARYRPEDRQLAAIERRAAAIYVQKQFNSLAANEFHASDRRLRVLLIGDSFAQDLTNALFEARFDEAIQLSTRHAVHGCGSLFLERSVCLRERAALGHALVAADTQEMGVFEDPAIRRRILAVDEVWFASAWQDWQTPLLTQSIANVRAHAHAHVTVRIFGRKDFGQISLRTLLATDAASRKHMVNVVDPATLKINAAFAEALRGVPRVQFLDIQAALCGAGAQRCALFTADAFLKSHDGGHLTREGARYLGQKLASDPELADLLARAKRR